LTLVPRTGSAEGAWAADGAVSLALCRRIRPRYAPLAVRLAFVGCVLACTARLAARLLRPLSESPSPTPLTVRLRGAVLVRALFACVTPGLPCRALILPFHTLLAFCSLWFGREGPLLAQCAA